MMTQDATTQEAAHPEPPTDARKASRPGEVVKVLLPGERPFAEVIEVTGQFLRARIVTKCWGEFNDDEQREWIGDAWGVDARPPKALHPYKRGDVLLFEAQERGWELAADPAKSN